MISIEQVTCFAKVFELQSFSAASSELGKARSTIRERINALEDLMGVELFTIQGKKAIPTDVAHQLYPRARLLARQSLEFENIAFSAYKGELDRITLYHDTSTPVQLLTAIDQVVKQRYSSIIINWLQRDREQSLQDVESGSAFLAIMPGHGILHPNSGVGSINLGAYSLHLFSSATSVLAEKPVSIAELGIELQLIPENELSNELRHTRISCDFEVVSCKRLLIEKLKVRGWTVSAREEMQPHIDSGDIREIEVIEAPGIVRQDCILFYNLSSEASPTESEIITTVTEVAKNYLSD
ncbi:LysR family transcriptional regulator [Vibrio maerlii]|uniref:LysR family transcriptional regulator n=1 Tax=Vibrio maerlii TaxID=2231648 RepID=UPI0013DF89F1|nr:LysR family transcriptional regulator [Vibrio maerlii]